jgi:serine protease
VSPRAKSATPARTAPAFEGFAVEFVNRTTPQKVRRTVADVLGAGWEVNAFGDRNTDFEITSDRRRRSVSSAWQDTYRLRAIPGVAYAEPLFRLAISAPPTDGDTTRPVGGPPSPAPAPARGRARARGGAVQPARSAGGDRHVPESDDSEWSLKQVRVFEAWRRFFPDGSRPPGAGVVIGHPDTGYRDHPEIVRNLLVERGFDFVKDDADPTDELERPPGVLLPNPGHGTGTASVIVSPRGSEGSYGTSGVVSGIAPGARLIPLRVAQSVVLFSMRNLSRAIEHAADNGAHVVSISMGGLFSFRLRSAISYAQKRGVIVCAAAGNQVRFVVWPAAYDEVMAVAACNARRGIWRGSSRGSKVDVTGPGESVWRAYVRKEGSSVEPDLGRSSGTSYAVATVAGIAALWLSYHGPRALAERYGAEKIPFLFNQLLRETCTPVAEWDTDKFGAGLVNAEALLAAPLPDTRRAAMRAPAPKLVVHPPEDEGTRTTFEHLFEESLRAAPAARATAPRSRRPSAGRARPRVNDDALSATLAEILRVRPEELPDRMGEVGQELAFHVAVNPELYAQFEAALDENAAPAARTRARAGRGAGAARSPRGASGAARAVRAGVLASGASPALAGQLRP